MSNSGFVFKAIFLLGGLIVLPWGLIIDSMVKIIGGLGLIYLSLITDGS